MITRIKLDPKMIFVRYIYLWLVIYIIYIYILENSSKSHIMKSSVLLHVFNDISTCVYVFMEYFLHSLVI